MQQMPSSHYMKTVVQCAWILWTQLLSYNLTGEVVKRCYRYSQACSNYAVKTYLVYKDLCKGQGHAECYNTSKNIRHPEPVKPSAHCQNVCQTFQSSMFMCTMNCLWGSFFFFKSEVDEDNINIVQFRFHFGFQPKRGNTYALQQPLLVWGKVHNITVKAIPKP